KPNSELENGLVELVVDKDVYEMLMYVDKFKVIELYTDHTVKKQHVLTQEPLATIIDVTQPDSSSGNEAEVDVSEDEWLRESYSQQYAQLRDYCMELKEKNPNTTVKIEVEPPEDPDSEERKFKRSMKRIVNCECSEGARQV
ncbi:hypothetical protein Tco_0258782, partial [Tanacetum coccineum]